MNIIAVIPARGGSKGIPNKNIIDFNGKPLIAWSIEQALASPHVSEVYVTSDSPGIRKIAEQYGATSVIRSKKTSSDTATSESAIKELIESLKIYPDAILFMQATSPLRTTEDINQAIKKFKKKKYDSLFSACELGDVCIWEDSEEGLKSVNYNYKSRNRRQDMDFQIVENGSFYLFKPYILLTSNNRLGGKKGFSLMDPWKIHEIDDYDDLELCSILHNKHLRR